MTKTAITRSLLRKAAAVVLENKLGYRVEPHAPGQGIRPGVRLLATKGSKTEDVAVRTNASRRVRGVRRDDGRWRTLSDVDFVVVAVPARDPANSVEVLGFSPQTIIDRLDATLKQLPKNSARDEPVIVALDDKVRSDARTAGLKSSAKWQHILSIDDPLLKEAATEETSEGFVQRVKREFAELNGVDVSKVLVKFEIIS